LHAKCSLCGSEGGPVPIPHPSGVSPAQDIGMWPENQIFIPDWTYFHCPGTTLFMNTATFISAVCLGGPARLLQCWLPFLLRASSWSLDPLIHQDSLYGWAILAWWSPAQHCFVGLLRRTSSDEYVTNVALSPQKNFPIFPL